MKFGSYLPSDALGGILAHSIHLGDLHLRKGTFLTPQDVAKLMQAGAGAVTVALLEQGDIHEDMAAAQLSVRLAGRGVHVQAPAQGRVNFYADTAGVLQLDSLAIHAFNRLDDAITLATLPNFKSVEQGDLIATIKIIPFSVASTVMERAIAQLSNPLMIDDMVCVSAYQPKRVALISTLLSGIKPSMVDKTTRVLMNRLLPAAASLIADVRVPHASAPLERALLDASGRDAEIIIVFGASAISDRRDILPAALEAVGGRVSHLGMPVDPGNLLMLGDLAGKPVLGAPGCARSPKENGFDWVLQRLLADIPVKKADIQDMGVGGLLTEIGSRPSPREFGRADLDGGGITAVVLAAGQSKRMNGRNRLLELWQGKPLLRHVVEAAQNAHVNNVLVVTGHEAPQIIAALSDVQVQFVHNADYALGLSTSVKAGLAQVPSDASAALFLLGDMPLVTPDTLNRIIAAFHDKPEACAVVPTLAGRRGNPVLIAQGFFDALKRQTGDQGARALIDAAGDAVVDVAIDEISIARDVDTLESLARLREQDC